MSSGNGNGGFNKTSSSSSSSGQFPQYFQQNQQQQLSQSGAMMPDYPRRNGERFEFGDMSVRSRSSEPVLSLAAGVAGSAGAKLEAYHSFPGDELTESYGSSASLYSNSSNGARRQQQQQQGMMMPMTPSDRLTVDPDYVGSPPFAAVGNNMPGSPFMIHNNGHGAGYRSSRYPAGGPEEQAFMMQAGYPGAGDGGLSSNDWKVSSSSAASSPGLWGSGNGNSSPYLSSQSCPKPVSMISAHSMYDSSSSQQQQQRSSQLLPSRPCRTISYDGQQQQQQHGLGNVSRTSSPAMLRGDVASSGYSNNTAAFQLASDSSSASSSPSSGVGTGTGISTGEFELGYGAASGGGIWGNGSPLGFLLSGNGALDPLQPSLIGPRAPSQTRPQLQPQPAPRPFPYSTQGQGHLQQQQVMYDQYAAAVAGGGTGRGPTQFSSSIATAEEQQQRLQLQLMQQQQQMEHTKAQLLNMNPASLQLHQMQHQLHQQQQQQQSSFLPPQHRASSSFQMFGSVGDLNSNSNIPYLDNSSSIHSNNIGSNGVWGGDFLSHSL